MVAIKIVSISEFATEPGRHQAQIKHNNNVIDVLIVGDINKLRAMIGIELCAEFALNGIRDVECIDEKDDAQSGIFQFQDDLILVDGTVFHVLEVDAERVLVDVYLRNVADYILFESDDLLGVRPSVGCRLRVQGRSLVVFPNVK